MPFALPRLPFTAWRIAGAPSRPGVYLLLQEDEIVYIGRAKEGMRERLMEHYTRQAKPWDATHFAVVASDDPVRREAEFLAEVQRTMGRLPRYNASA